MSERCPTSGYTCVNTMVARVQALTDQIQGLLFFLRENSFEARAGFLCEHYQKVADLLQSTLDDYARDHGTPPPSDDVAAVAWALKEMTR